MEAITPEDAKRRGDSRSLDELKRLARSHARCENCGQPVWRFGGIGMCFPCTTGESDDANDYELVDDERKRT